MARLQSGVQIVSRCVEHVDGLRVVNDAAALLAQPASANDENT